MEEFLHVVFWSEVKRGIRWGDQFVGSAPENVEWVNATVIQSPSHSCRCHSAF